MSRLRHLIATDARRYWPLMAAYAGMVVADTALDLALPGAALNPAAGPLVALASAMTGFAKLLLSAVVVVMVVHAHPLVGSDAFWTTRPISPRALLVSKLLPLAVLVVGLPVACEIVLMASYAVPLRVMALVALQGALWQTFWLALFMTGAAVTRNLAGFALLAAGTVTAAAVAVAVSAALAFRQMDDDFFGGTMAIQVGSVAPVADTTGAVLWLTLFPVAAFALMAVQYQTRLRWRAAAVGVTGLALLWAIAAYWPWPLLQARVAAADWASQPARGTLTSPPGAAAFPPASRYFGGRSRFRPLVARVGIDNLDPGWRARVQLVSASIDQGNGQVFESRGMPYAQDLDYGLADETIHSAAARRLLQVERLAGVYRPPEPDTTVLLVPDRPPSPMPAGVYTGTFAVELTHLAIEAVLPLRAGESHRRDADRVVIDRIQTYPALTVSIRRSGATTVFDRREPTVYEFYVRNRLANEAVVAMADPILSPVSLFFSGMHFDPLFGFGAAEYAVVPQNLPNGLKMDDRWLDDAELVIVRATARQPLSRTLRIENFRVEER